MNTSIRYMDYYIPQTNVTVEEVISLNKDNPLILNGNYEAFLPRFKEESKLNKISVFSSCKSILDIVTDMVDKFFRSTGIDPLEISYLVCGNHALVDENISVIHCIYKKFHLDNAAILSLNEPCAASVIAMGLSKKLLNTTKREYMLVLSVNKSCDIKSRFKGFTIMGDGISLVLIENQPNNVNIVDWHHTSFIKSNFDKIGIQEYSPALNNVSKVQRDIIKNGSKFLKRTLNKMNICVNDVDAIIHPNTNYEVWHNIYCQLLNTNAELFYTDNISYGGHINDVDLVRNTKDFIEKNKNNKKQMKVIIFAINLFKSQDINYHVISLEVGSTS